MQIILSLVLGLLTLTAHSHSINILGKPHFSFLQLTTLDTCGIFTNRRDSIHCNPASFKSSATEGLTFHLSTKTEGDSVELGKKIIFDPITKETLEELFELDSFSSWDANSMIEFRNSLFYLSYDPVYATANFFVFNPAYPEVSLMTSSQRRINITMGEEFNLNNNIFSIGGSLFYFERSYFSGTFALLDVNSKGIGELIDFEKTNGINADLGFIYHHKDYEWIPKLSIIARNIGSLVKVNEDNIDSEKLIEPILLYEPYSKIDLGYDFKTLYGYFGVAVGAPFNKNFSEFYSDYIATSVNYSIWDFELSGAISKFSQVSSFKFSSPNNAIGVNFGRSKALGDFLSDYESFSYVSLEIYL